MTQISSEEKIFGFLNNTEHGYAKINEMPLVSLIQQLVTARCLIRVQMSFKKGVGKWPKRREERTYFNKGFYNTTFICLNRTALVRLFMQALKKPTTFLAKKRVTSLLRRHLTHAEQIAVLWSLGKRNFPRSQRKRNIQIDEVYFPIKHYNKVKQKP